jgi:hypothetical protein
MYESVLESRPWLRIAMLLGSLTTPHEETPKWLHSMEPSDDIRDVVAQMKQVEAGYKKEIDSAIYEWKGERRPLWLKGLAGSILQSRIQIAYTFVLSLNMLDSNISMKVFPPPVLPDEDVVRFLLIEWWNEHGLRIFALLPDS